MILVLGFGEHYFLELANIGSKIDCQRVNILEDQLVLFCSIFLY